MIKRIEDIGALYEWGGLDRTPVTPQFDVLKHKETYPFMKAVLPPHRRNFYSLIFLEDQQAGSMTINNTQYQQRRDVLFCQSPDHVFSFVRGDALEGYLVFFSAEFLLPMVKDLRTEYPFFALLNTNLFQLSPDEKSGILKLLTLLYQERDNLAVARYVLLGLLEKVRGIQQRNLQAAANLSKPDRLVQQFHRLVNVYYIEKRQVAAYAILLGVTANYLNELVKKTTGISAKKHLQNRLCLEAKNLLRASSSDIAEIAYFLGFSEPTNFGKFFKQQEGCSPKYYRENR